MVQKFSHLALGAGEVLRLRIAKCAILGIEGVLARRFLCKMTEEPCGLNILGSQRQTGESNRANARIDRSSL